MLHGQYGVVVIGGGIVGLSTALHLTQTFPRIRVLLVEKEQGLARHQSGHNSGVIHSGIYYKPGSLKAKLCVEGARAMVAFCQEHGINHKICGKLIVATEQEELTRLQALFERAQTNGLQDVRWLGPNQIQEIEPHCRGLKGLHIASTGVVDYIEVCEKYAEIIRSLNGTVRLGTRVEGLRISDRETVVETNQGSFSARFVINCAGLHSDRIGRMAGEKSGPCIVPFRGEYYDLIPEKQNLVKTLIYPVPDPRFPFLGVHFTRRIHGGVDAGPNAVLALKREGYRWCDASLRDILETAAFPGFWRLALKYWRQGAKETYRSFHKAAFVQALQRLVPEIQGADLAKDGAGVRAQALLRDGSLVDDFSFERTPNMLHVYNVPSPAATASLSIGRTIVAMVEQDFRLDVI